MDLLLSSGFLAFARHAGVLSAVDEAALPVDAVVGTSSGAMVGALWAAGHAPEVIMAELAARRPLARLRPSATPWRGALALDGVVEHLARLLPPRFAGLRLPLAVGVVDARGQHRLITEGPLPEAVVASCAMPFVFTPVSVDGVPYADGGAADRLGLAAWRAWRGPSRRALAHHVRRTRGVDVAADLDGVTVVQTPRSGASFWSLGDWPAQVAEAKGLTRAVLAELTQA